MLTFDPFYILNAKLVVKLSAETYNTYMIFLLLLPFLE